MKINKRKIIKIFGVLLTVVITITSTSCAGKPNAGFDLKTLSDFDSRVGTQQELVRYLADANAISQETADAMISQTVSWVKFMHDAADKNTLGQSSEDAGTGFLVINSQQFAQLQKSLSMVNYASILGQGTHQYTYGSQGELKSQNGGLGIGGQKNPQPYGFSGDDMKSLQEATRYKVKVLKDHMAKDVTLDSLSKAIGKAKAAGASNAKECSELEGYFQDTGKVTTNMPILHATFPWDSEAYTLGTGKDAVSIPPVSGNLLNAVYGGAGESSGSTDLDTWETGGVQESEYGTEGINSDIWDITEPIASGGWKFKSGFESYYEQDPAQTHDLKIWTTGYRQAVRFKMVKEGDGYVRKSYTAIDEAPELAGMVRLEQVNKLFVNIIIGKSNSDQMFIN